MILNVTGHLAIDKRTKDWCLFPYPGHKDGCPNAFTCKERFLRVDRYFNLKKDHWFIILPFNIQDQADYMYSLHPGWSDKQTRCCLYWQQTVRKDLRNEVEKFIFRKPQFDKNNILLYSLIPEGMGVNVFRTCHRFGVPIKKNPQKILYKIAMIGYA